MASPAPSESAAKYSANAQASQGRFVKGVQSTDKDVIGLAIQAAPLWAQKIQEAIANDSFRKGLGRTNTASWKAVTSTKGAAAYTAAIPTAAKNWERAENEIRPLREQMVASLPPRGTDAQNDQRALAAIQGMRALRRNR